MLGSPGSKIQRARRLPAAALTGTVPAARMPALTGDVTTSVGTVATAVSSGVLLTKHASTTAPASGFAGMNIGITASVAANALTISLTDAAGATPSAASPVLIPFHNLSLANGAITWRAVTAATTLVISSGSTMGAVANVAFRIWIVAFDDAGTVRLGAIKCSAPGVIFPLSEEGLASSTAEGGAGAADNFGVIYTGVAVTTKPFKIIGWLAWEAGLATPGTWSGNPSYIRNMSAGGRKPGDVVQCTYTTFSTGTTNTTVTFADTTVTANITPTSAANAIYVDMAGQGSHATAGGGLYVIMLRTATQIGPTAFFQNNAGAPDQAMLSIKALDFPNSAVATTYKAQLRSNIATNSVQFPGSIGTAPYASLGLQEIMG